MHLQRLDYARLARLSAVVTAFAATILLVVPFAPFVGGLDGEAWRYAMNVAVADHMVFGRDIIFTAGPLSTVYTHAYHPATDVFLIGVSLILATALFAGFAAITPPARRPWLLLLPVLLSQTTFEGATILALPLLLLLSAEKATEQGCRLQMAATYGLVVACTLLPLVKGTMAIAVAACLALTFLALWRRSRVASLGIVVVGLVTLCGTWMLAGQPLAALPVFFASQIPVVSGYTIAMAQPGNTWEAVVFPMFAIFAIWAMWRHDLRQGWRVVVAVALLLFLAFKAGFVRHDTHATIAASSLALAGLIAFLEKPRITTRGATGLVVGFAGFALISMSYQSFDTLKMQERLFQELGAASSGLATRILHPGSLQKGFAEENARLRTLYPLPPFSGDADLYPENVAALLASGTRWNPRPTIITYTAYTPALLRADADHLREHGAARIYFALAPIDSRYPALGDSLSWPVLLGTYAPTGFVDRYAILDRRSPSQALVFGKVAESTGEFGRTIPLENHTDALWAKIDVQPTLLGKLASTVYKAPRLIMSVSYNDGTRKNYTFVPGMASEGFLLSPTVSSAEEFAALTSHKQANLLAGKYVKTITIAGESGTRWLWKHDFTFSVQDVSIPALDSTDTLLFDKATPAEHLSDVPDGGDCSIDSIDEKPVNPAGNILPADLLRVRGWTMVSTASGRANEDVRILLTRGDQTFVAPTRMLPRPDVAAFFGHPEESNIGFRASVDTSDIHGTFVVRILQTSDNVPHLCPVRATVTLP
ncbi:hypothetical protein [Luteibacter sp. 9135]|uniref:hypothetical protein n=1 Tax=Luteibacter sp. 9135 TaxID=1500893 RepID=UPI00056749DC|nr:hypothetical protein [Luteibacter sp. 9135]